MKFLSLRTEMEKNILLYNFLCLSLWHNSQSSYLKKIYFREGNYLGSM
jgi:hypothetical protein